MLAVISCVLAIGSLVGWVFAWVSNPEISTGNFWNNMGLSVSHLVGTRGVSVSILDPVFFTFWPAVMLLVFGVIRIFYPFPYNKFILIALIGLVAVSWILLVLALKFLKIGF